MQVTLQVISLDVWGTLIRSNPQNKHERTKALAPLLGWTGDPALLTKALGNASRILDKVSDQNGVQYGTKERLGHACESLGITMPTGKRYEEIVERIHETQLRFPTPLTEPDLPDTLRRWCKEFGLRLAIISNTGTACGRTLAALLDQHGLMQYIDYPLWSDEVGVAKPNPAIFARLVEVSGIPAASILHLGDNPLTDVAGPAAAGFNSLHYNARRGTEVTPTSYLSHATLEQHDRFRNLLSVNA